jgi:hypothetical protein
MKRITNLGIALILSVSYAADAYAWGWLALRAGATRGAAVSGARAAGAEGTALRGSTGAARAAASAGQAVRYCVRPKNAAQCDFHYEKTAYDAAAKAVGPRNTVVPTGDVGVFQVIDAAGTLIDVIESLSEAMDPSTSRLPQYPNENQSSGGNQYSNTHSSVDSSYAPRIPDTPSNARSNAPRIPDAPQVAQPSPSARGEIWQYELNFNSYVISSNGPIVVWTEGGEGSYALSPYQTIAVSNRRTLFVAPQSNEATGISLVPSVGGEPRQQQRSRPTGVFPYGSNVSCPQIPIGNGMARCQ